MRLPGNLVVIGAGLLSVVNCLFAEQWTQTDAPALPWWGVAISADGGQLAAVNSDGGIYTSTNSGRIWTQKDAPSNNWGCIASSADGWKLVAAGGYYGKGSIYTSADAGATWASNSAPIANWNSVASSADGNKLVAASSSSLYTSTNAGGWWTSNDAPVLGWMSVASSADGTKLVAAAANLLGGVYTSTNSGNSWAKVTTGLGVWRAVACSANGDVIASEYGPLSGPPTRIYVSTNGGVSWTSNNVTGFSIDQHSPWAAIACSADGSRLVAMDGYIQTSTNFGVTWQTNDLPNEYWNSVASSADGHRFVAVSITNLSGGGGEIRTLYSEPSPRLNAALSSTNVVLSWMTPSTNFILQQNSDLISTGWIGLTNSYVLNSTNLEQEIFLPTIGSGFYRLATP